MTDVTSRRDSSHDNSPAPQAETRDDAGNALPGFLGEIAVLAGRTAALGVARARGGVEKVYIPTPAHLTTGHWLVRAAGWRAAVLIAHVFGPSRIDIPLGPIAFRRPHRRQTLRFALAMGNTTAEAARRAGVSERTARRHLERMTKDTTD